MDNAIDKAFRAVPRQNFLPEAVVDSVGLDRPLPIGFGQTNSQPTTVAMMLDWLAVEPGQTILDVGSGSGWTTALLAHLTGQAGKVIAVEIVPELVEFGRQNCQRLGIGNVSFYQAGKQYGWPPAGPYDRILVSAASQAVPPELIDQLKPGGRLVIPVQSSILVIDKDTRGNLEQYEHPGFSFVPLV
ncbi:protein-L-isoaspartate O-methyltransferase [Candidatus Saccharibacteria bacterium CG_4_10_14_0_2_um_filter_52_9]|nr:MAG: protein-L-isoaspartate O-methyltransferase [Candidatus Saccharibacteria bacterium CG_4_10_14_0_2_um_filter_52_9]